MESTREILIEVDYVRQFTADQEAFLCTPPTHDRAEKRKWLRQCPAASNVGSSAPSFKMIGILREKKHLCLK